MKPYLIKRIYILALISAIVFISSCDALTEILEDENTQEAIARSLGWIGDRENTAGIENDINLGSTTNLAPSVDLSAKFPPIGNQGQYGTCVAWATAYNMRTFLEAVDKNYSASTIANDNNKQFSPKDLFWALSNKDKGADCNGAGFEAAFDLMVARGVATLSKVPYTNMGDCSSTPPSDWTSNANTFKIENYREITKDVKTLKKYLSEGRAIVFGAKLGENFMSWNSANVLTTDGDTYNGQHAYHAMTLCGYDDTKGPNGAFRVVNSWGKDWGDNGYIWIDQNFFVSDKFCFCAFVASIKTTNPDTNGDNNVDVVTTGDDLLAWELADSDDPTESDPRTRDIVYNVFNSGQTKIAASKDWNIIYVYYNAYDANDYGVLLYDYYSNDYGVYGSNGSFSSVSATGDGISGNWWNHIDISSTQSVAEALYGGADSRFRWGYTMPTKVTGYYYLVIIADGYNKVKETNEDNNYFFFTQTNGDPIYISNGVISSSNSLPSKTKSLQRPDKFAASPSQTTISGKNVNAYSPKEIKMMLENRKANGDIQRKVQEFLSMKKSLKGKQKA